MKFVFVTFIVSFLTSLTASHELGGPEACDCHDSTVTSVPDFNISNFTWVWDAASNTDIGSFDVAFWPGAPPASCRFSVPASTGYPVSTSPNDTFCHISRPENAKLPDMFGYFLLTESQTVGFQVISPADRTDDPSLVFTIQV